MKISHTADIHIRSLTRHDEHEHAFQNLLNTSLQRGSDYLLIAGDIFHTKTSGISPEYIELLSKWIEKFSNSFKKVIITLGNHDLNLKNLERGDAVSPIVGAMNLQNVFLLKNTTQFDIDENTVLSVFSIVDPENWETLKPVAGKINIATFHGPVSGCRLDSGIEYESGVSISLFDSFDFAMLGDIHKTQFLNSKKTIGYPGSIIQNTFDEEIDRGYFLWDISSKAKFTCEFISVGNLSPN
jgi:DNA repair exonuclease SbcCD nuclease subunit